MPVWLSEIIQNLSEKIIGNFIMQYRCEILTTESVLCVNWNFWEWAFLPYKSMGRVFNRHFLNMLNIPTPYFKHEKHVSEYLCVYTYTYFFYVTIHLSYLIKAIAVKQWKIFTNKNRSIGQVALAIKIQFFL